MSKARRAAAPSGGQVVIRLDQRFFYGLIAVIGIVAIFLIGMVMGRATAPASSQPQAVAVFPQTQLQQPGQQPLQIQQLQPGQQIPPFTEGRDPNLLRPAGDDVPIGDNPRLALPDLVETDYDWDFGEMGPNEPVETVLTIANTGTKELVIDRATSSCGCTAALLSDKNIAPGEEAQLRITYDPRQYQDRGPVTKYVDILSNDPAASQVRFTISAFVRDQ